MLVTPIAATVFNPFNAEASGYKAHDDEYPASMDELSEMAGRNCYQSWDRPNPKTASNKGYLKNILDQGHYSVLEHSSISFYVAGVSRALLTELSRHRFLSFSVISQRYVRMDREDFVTPPAIEEYGDLTFDPELWTIHDEFEYSLQHSFDAYNHIAEQLMAAGLSRKQALEAARSVLPNATEVKMVVTGNIRAWRDVIGKRYHEAADEEIKQFAAEVLKHLRTYAPNSVLDIPEVPYGNG